MWTPELYLSENSVHVTKRIDSAGHMPLIGNPLPSVTATLCGLTRRDCNTRYHKLSVTRLCGHVCKCVCVNTSACVNLHLCAQGRRSAHKCGRGVKNCTFTCGCVHVLVCRCFNVSAPWRVDHHYHQEQKQSIIIIIIITTNTTDDRH